jgi:hypothetical protein
MAALSWLTNLKRFFTHVKIYLTSINSTFSNLIKLTFLALILELSVIICYDIKMENVKQRKTESPPKKAKLKMLQTRFI